MAKGVTLTGFKEFSDKINRLPKELIEEADVYVQDAAQLWEQKAKQDAPIDQGRLRAEISSFKNKDGNWEIVSQADYSAYIEWGTKSKARVPSELSAYASQFKGGTGGDPKKFIFEWCKRKGIPKETWFPIFISIIRNGIAPHPYFFIQAPLVESQLMKDLKQLIESYD